MSPADARNPALPDWYTKLGHWRYFRDLSQKELAARAGIPFSTLRRLEQGDYTTRPNLRYLSNCAIALGCDSVLDLIEDELLEWTPLGEAQQPPAPLPDWKPGRPSTLDGARPGLKAGRPVMKQPPKRVPKTPDELYRELDEEMPRR